MKNFNFENTIDLLTIYKEMYEKSYNNFTITSGKESPAALDLLKSVEAFDTVIKDLNREMEYQKDQEAHAEVTY